MIMPAQSQSLQQLTNRVRVHGEANPESHPNPQTKTERMTRPYKEF